MADLPADKDADQITGLRNDINELARGINVQARILESVVVACDTIVKAYLAATNVQTGVAEAPKEGKEVR